MVDRDTARKGWFPFARVFAEQEMGHAALFLFCPLALLGLLGSLPDIVPVGVQVAYYPVAARWLSRLVSLGAYLVVFLYASRGGSLLAQRWVLGVNGVALLAGILLMAFLAGLFPIYLLASILIGCSSAFLLLAWAEYLTLLDGSTRWMTIMVAAAVDAVVILVFRLAGGILDVLIYLFIAVGMFLPLMFRGYAVPASGSAGAGSRCSGRSRPETTVRPSWRAVPWELLVLMVCYALVFRVLQNFDYSVPILTPLVRFGVIIIFLAILWAVIVRHGDERVESSRMVLFLFFLVVSALVLIPLGDTTLRAVCSAIASSCWPLFYYLLWAILLDLGDRPELDSLEVFSFGWLILNIALVLAAPLAFLLAQQVNAGTLSLTALVLVLAYTLSVASFLVQRRRIEQAHGAKAGEQMEFDGLCDRLAAEYSLTNRETEVFRLLARGRSVPFISEALVISQSTAKGHVKHIYEKLGVAGKQGMLDLIDRESR